MIEKDQQGLGLAPASARDYRALARRRLPRQIFDYLDGGAYEEVTLRENCEAFYRYRLRQRVMRDVSSIDLSTRVLGQDLKMPVILSPIGMAGSMARRGEVQAARAAEKAGIVFCESTVSVCPIEEVRKAVSKPFWHQLYVMRDRGYTKEMMRRAEAAGCPVLVLTVDLAVVGARYRDVRNGLGQKLPLWAKLRRGADIAAHAGWVWDVAIRGKPLVFGNLTAAVPDARALDNFKDWVDRQFDPTVNWDDIAWVRDNWKGKLVVKGILDVEDAREAAARGVDGISVSNHGGRQLDGVAPSLDALPAIAEAVGDRVEVLMDGGVRSGADVVKALALGARACLIGRAWAYALAARGEAGVAHVLTVMKGEMRVAMALSGVTTIPAITRDVLMRGE
jgi:L-lactate dehydrogenase (cytochrome)